MKRTILFALLSMTACPAWSAETPHAGAADPRVRWVNYDPQQVYRLVGAFRSAMQVVFGANEQILHVALGDTLSWEVAPADNILFIKPREHAGPTNLIVSTNGRAGIRNYQFELVARGGSITAATPNTFFQIRFHYPVEETARSAAAAAADQVRQIAALEAGGVRLALDQAVIEGARNWRYTAQGASELQPSEVSDNGQFMLLRFPNHHELPALFAVAPDGTESLVPFDVRDDWVVIHEVVREIRLRRGDLVLCLYNEGAPTYGVDPKTGTASAHVTRSLTQEHP